MNDHPGDPSIPRGAPAQGDLLDLDPGALGEDVVGPVRIIGGPQGVTAERSVEVAARWLVPLEAWGGTVYIPLPVTGILAIDAAGEVRSARFVPPVPGAQDEARAWARTLLDGGQVDGADQGERGPGAGAPSHTLVLDHRGRRVIERRRFAGGIAG